MVSAANCWYFWNTQKVSFGSLSQKRMDIAPNLTYSMEYSREGFSGIYAVLWKIKYSLLQELRG